MKLFQIHEGDLQDLERILPQLQNDLFDQLAKPEVAPRLKRQLRMVKEILSNVRWNYGPPDQVESFPADGPVPTGE